MNKKSVFGVLGVLVVIAGVIVAAKLGLFKRSHKRVVGNCEVTLEDISMADTTMTGIYEAGEKLIVEKGYYVCNSPVPGDTVLYRYSEARPPVIKRIVAVEGDQFKTVKDGQGRGWNLEVNGDVVKAVSGSEYFFGSPNPPTLSLYEKPRNGILGKNEVILFSSQPPGREDSGIFGLVSTGDLLGRVKKN